MCSGTYGNNNHTRTGGRQWLKKEFVYFVTGPTYYYPEFKAALEAACPDNTDLHVLLGQQLKKTRVSDMNIYFVKEHIRAEKKKRIPDKRLLELLEEGETQAVVDELRRCIALDAAEDMWSFGEAYGPPKSKSGVTAAEARSNPGLS